MKTPAIPVLLLLLSTVLSLQQSSAPVSALSESNTPRAPILIDGDQDFTPANGVTGGNGTPDDPYRIEGWSINATSQDGIRIRNTRAHFTINNVNIYSVGQNHNGTVLVNVYNGQIVNSTYYNHRYGIRTASTNNIILAENNITNNQIGMFLSGARFTITGNLFTGNQDGLRLGAAFTGLVTDNEFASNTHYGINLDYSHNITVNRNTFTGNGVSLYGSSLFYLNTHTITPDNLVNGKPILYYKDCSGENVNGVTLGQLIFVNCTNIRVSNVQINYTDIGLQLLYVEDALVFNNQISQAMVDGVRVQSSTNITITDNVVFRNGMYGLDMFSASNISVTNNLFTENSFGGMFLFNSENITLTHNTVSDNTWYGAVLAGSTRIRTHHNNFLNNRNGVSDNRGSENQWDDGYPSGGNYWSDYTGVDSCSGPGQDVCPDPDGIGDTAYVIDSDSRDKYPLMQPVEVHDIAVSELTATPSYLVQGQYVSIIVSASNLGDAPENFTVTVYYNNTLIGSQNVQNLSPGSSQNLVFQWNTTNVTPGTYMITATAGPVPGETRTQDNTLANETVTIVPKGVFPFLSAAHRQAEGSSSVDVVVTFPDNCHQTLDWGTPERDGNSFTVQLYILDLHSSSKACLPAVNEDRYAYQLGSPDPGEYRFSIVLCLHDGETGEASCHLATSLDFTIKSPRVQPSTGLSFWPQYWYLFLATAVFVTVSLLVIMGRVSERNSAPSGH